MAGSVIGALRVDLGLNSAKFEMGVKNARKSMAGLGASAAGVAKSMALAGAAIGVAFAGLERKFVQNTIIQQDAVQQLNAALKSTGAGAWASSKAMQDMAASLQRVTTYGDEAVIPAEALLLTFTRIGKDIFPDAIKSVLDVSTAMKQDLKTSVLQVGKALNDPIAGLGALSRAGIQFSEAQKSMVREMVRVGDQAGAQKVILAELQRQFGGSAEAARGTLGGALKALGNAFGDLFELSGAGTENMRKSLEDLTDTLSSSETKHAIETFGNWLTSAFNVVVQGAAKSINALDAIGQAFQPIAGQSTQFLQDRLDAFNSMPKAWTGGEDVTKNPEYQAVAAELARRKAADAVSGAGASLPQFKLPDFTPMADGATKAAAALKPLDTNLASVADTMQTAAQTMAVDFKGAFQGFFSGIAHGKSAIDSLRDSLGNLADQLLSMATNNLFNAIFGGLSGGFNPIANFVGSGFGAYGKFANGTNYAPGGWAMVGERGPEMVNLPRGSQVIPNNRLGNGGPPTVRIELGDGLEASIIDQANAGAVQIVKQGFKEYDRGRLSRFAQDFEHARRNRFIR